MGQRLATLLQGAALGLASSVFIFNAAGADTDGIQFHPVENPEACIEMADASKAYSDSIIGGGALYAECHTAEDGSTYLSLENVR